MQRLSLLQSLAGSQYETDYRMIKNIIINKFTQCNKP